MSSETTHDHERDAAKERQLVACPICGHRPVAVAYVVGTRLGGRHGVTLAGECSECGAHVSLEATRGPVLETPLSPDAQR